MSGIVAIVNFDGSPVDPQVLKKMAEQCAYRGPDGIRYWIQGNVGMAHLALHATQEALRELMPMTSADGSLCLTADARVDNRPELMELLNANGTPFPSEPTDADLILAAYQAFGEACPGHIIGDYAFAIWDASRQHLFCTRDALGLKVLHYAREGQTLCVASEAQQIIQHPAFPPQLDELTVAYYLIDYLQDETRSMFEGVHKLAPGHLFSADQSGPVPKRYWDIDPNFKTTYDSDEEYAAHFLKIFERAVADRLRTPDGTGIGITMSGGMDSTSVAAVAQRIINNQSGQPSLLACSYAFEYLKECDERQYSQAVADHCGIELIYVPAENFWFLDNDETYTPSLETPFLSAEESLTKHIMGLFKNRNRRVWLTGHGGDSLIEGSTLIYVDRFKQGDLNVFREIMCIVKDRNLPNSTIFRTYLNWILKPLIPSSILRFYRKLKKPPIPEWLDTNFIIGTQLPEHILASSSLQKFTEYARNDNYKKILTLGSVDRASSLTERYAALFQMEARHPFMDRRLAEFVLSIPSNQTYRIGISKFILREAMKGILPEFLRTRLDKTGFARYFNMGFKYKETAKIKGLLTSPLLSTLEIVYSKKLLNVYERYLSEKQDWSLTKGYTAVTLEIWLRKYFQLFTVEESMSRKFYQKSEIKQDLKSFKQVYLNIYHPPQIIEWGDLRDITKGNGNTTPKDSLDTGLSGGATSPVYQSYPIPPWEIEP